MTLTADQLRATADAVVSALAGPTARVRDDQLAAVHVLVIDKRRALVVQATGWGKSAVYWIAAKAVRDEGLGPVLVVSPLLALMRDQVEAAGRAGLRAETLNSSNLEDWAQVEERLRAHAVDVLLVSPERLANPRFAARVLAPLRERLGLLVIDEAHCISSWGHDFRPDYLRLARLLAGDPDLPVLATTATANARVTADVAAQLGDGTFVQRGKLARDSLHLSVVPGLGDVERYAWVDQALGVLPGSGIVYVLTKADADRLAGFLDQRGHDVRPYHGDLDPEQRHDVEESLRHNRIKAVIATSALGMGYDKPDLAFCVHVGSPGSPVDYYQQVGRAGRALDSAEVVLLPGSSDERLWAYFATATIPRPEDAQAVLEALSPGAGARSVPALEADTGVRRGRLEVLLKTLAVDDAVERTSEGWIGTGIPWAYDHDRYDQLRVARQREASIMRDYASGQLCLETSLRLALDDQVTADDRCGRCSVCTGHLPDGLPERPAAEAVCAATSFLRGLDVVVEPRKMWAQGMRSRRGRISADVAVDEGRALAFADDPVWPEVMALTAEGAGDREPPGWCVDAVVSVLSRWSRVWGQRPVAVVPLTSRRRPSLVAGLASAVGSVGQLPVVDMLQPVGPRVVSGGAMSARARDLDGGWEVRQGVEVPRGPVLLVDDVYTTGWTMTIAGAVLREAGVPRVLPLVLHRRP